MRRRFHILTHSDNVNPFPGSYVNSRTEMSMQPISMGNQTRYEIDTKYLTEPESVVSALPPCRDEPHHCKPPAVDHAESTSYLSVAHACIIDAFVVKNWNSQIIVVSSCVGCLHAIALHLKPARDVNPCAGAPALLSAFDHVPAIFGLQVLPSCCSHVYAPSRFNCLPTLSSHTALHA